jgi:hypothetical protein
MGNSKVVESLKKNFVSASISTMRDVVVGILKAEIRLGSQHRSRLPEL